MKLEDLKVYQLAMEIAQGKRHNNYIKSIGRTSSPNDQ